MSGDVHIAGKEVTGSGVVGSSEPKQDAALLLLADIKSNTAGGSSVVGVKNSEDARISPATEDTLLAKATEDTLRDLREVLSRLLDRLDFGMVTDKTKTLLVQLNPILTSTVAVGTVSTLTSLTNTVRQGDLQMQRVNEALLDTAFLNGITSHITF